MRARICKLITSASPNVLDFTETSPSSRLDVTPLTPELGYYFRGSILPSKYPCRGLDEPRHSITGKEAET